MKCLKCQSEIGFSPGCSSSGFFSYTCNKCGTNNDRRLLSEQRNKLIAALNKSQPEGKMSFAQALNVTIE